ALQRRLPGRRLALAGHQAIAEDELVDVAAGEPGTRYRRLDRHAAEIRRAQRREVAEQAADGCSRGGRDDDGIVVHWTWGLSDPARSRLRCFAAQICLANSPGPTHELARAFRANPVQSIRARRAERAFVATNISAIVIGFYRPRTSLTAFAHFQCHFAPPL